MIIKCIRLQSSPNNYEIHVYLQLTEQVYNGWFAFLLLTSLVPMTSSQCCRKTIRKSSNQSITGITVTSYCFPDGTKMKLEQHRGKTAVGEGLIEQRCVGKFL